MRSHGRKQRKRLKIIKKVIYTTKKVLGSLEPTIVPSLGAAPLPSFEYTITFHIPYFTIRTIGTYTKGSSSTKPFVNKGYLLLYVSYISHVQPAQVATLKIAGTPIIVDTTTITIT